MPATARGLAATRDRSIRPASSSVPGAWCSTSVEVLLGWRHAKSRDAHPGGSGGLAADWWSSCAARGQTKNRGPDLAHGSWFGVGGGPAACQLPRGGRKSPAERGAIGRDVPPGERRVALHHIYLR